MGMISIQKVTKQFAGQVVLQDVSLELHTGRVVGLVGANGAGKTTLFKLIAGLIDADQGTITRTKGLDIGYLQQEPDVDPKNTLHDEVAGAFQHLFDLEKKLHTISDRMSELGDGPQLEELMKQYDQTNARFDAAGGYAFAQRINEVLGGLGFAQSDHQLPISVLSGGQKCRAALAKLLLADRRFLLLDEPTNHLDIDAIRWLEKFLASHHGGAAIISHDRYLLDRLSDGIIEIENRQITTYPGNYTNYAKTKHLRLLTEQRQHQKDQDFIRKEREFIAKHLAGQRTKEAKGRRTRLERRIGAGEFVLETAQQRRQVKIDFQQPDAKDATVLRLEELAKSYDTKALFTDLSLLLQAGTRLGITGPNGTGKTTLLKAILGEITLDHGRIEIGRKTTIGYYAQEPTQLDPTATAIECIHAIRPDFSELQARSYLARFLFTADDVFKTVSQLSGGEQSRVRLAQLLLTAPDLLIFDEPTNHLDIPSREALEEALADFPGTIIAVSHDRYFLDAIVDQLLVIRPDSHALYQGNYSYYTDQLEQEAAKRAGAMPKPKARACSPDSNKPKSQPSPYDRHSIDRLEELIIEKEQTLADLNAKFTNPAIYQDGQAVADLRQHIDAAKQDLDEVEQAWSERSEDP